MAFLQDGQWYRVTFKHTNDPSWSALPEPRPSIPHHVIDAMATGQSILVWVYKSQSGEFFFHGGACYGWSDTLLASVTGPLPHTVLTASDGKTYDWCNPGDGFMYLLDDSNVQLREFDIKQMSEFKAFLP